MNDYLPDDVKRQILMLDHALVEEIIRDYLALGKFRRLDIDCQYDPYSDTFYMDISKDEFGRGEPQPACALAKKVLADIKTIAPFIKFEIRCHCEEETEADNEKSSLS